MGLGIIAGYGGLKLISGVSEAMLRDLQQRLARTENETKDFTQHTEKEFKEVKANQLASLATDHVTRNNYKEAVEMCDQALSVDPELIRAWGIKGNALKRLNEYKKAIEAMDKGLAVDKGVKGNERAGLLFNRACYRALKNDDTDLDLIIKDLDDSIALDKDIITRVEQDDDLKNVRNTETFRTHFSLT